MTDRIDTLHDVADEFGLDVEVNLYTDRRAPTRYEVWTYDETGQKHSFQISESDPKFEIQATMLMQRVDEAVPGSGTTSL